jgi:ammonium transporter, Amt family
MPFVKDQLSTEMLLLAFIYVVGAMAVVLVVLALGFIDTGLVRRKNVLDTWIAKLTAALIAGATTLLGGIAIWNWQFNSAFGVPHPLGQAIKDWWIGGAFVNHYAGQLAFDKLPEAEVQQVFVAFFITFSLATLALIHTGAMERMRPAPLYVMAAVIGLPLSPFVAYMCWGPVGLLSNHGTHDFDGVFPLYIFAGTWVLVLSHKLKPRLGAFTPHPTGTAPAPSNIGLATAGVVLIMFALPFIAIGSTFIIPETGVFGISMTGTGIGIIVTNILASYSGGAIVGAFIAYRLKQPVWALLGPLAGAVICGTLFDVGMPWEVFLVSMAGPPVALATARLVTSWGIDEQKVIPLALGPGVVGALITGFIEWGTKTGGYPGAKGDYALQHATITPWWQLAGIVATMLVAAIPCWAICTAFERRGRLRVTEAEEVAGLDQTIWGVSNDSEEVLDGVEVTSLKAGASDRPPVTAGG